MAAVLFNPFYFSIDGNGVPRAGATYSFFQTGTSTPQNTFTDSTLVTPNANPVVADSNGLFPPIYLSASFDYKVILKDSSGVTIATRDPIGFTPAVTAAPFRSSLAGLTLSAAGGTGTFSVAAGAAADTTNTTTMTLAASISKTTSAWAVGSGSGGLDTGAIANATWYHVHEIMRTDTGVVDVLFSLSVSTPTMPANYTLFRRIGSILTDGSAHWIAFKQLGDEFLWSATVSDQNSATVTSVAGNVTLTVPTGLQVWARFRGLYVEGGGTSGLIYFPLDQATPVANTPSGNLSLTNTGAAQASGEFTVRTNTSAQIGCVASAAANVASSIATYGWIDRRGKDA